MLKSGTTAWDCWWANMRWAHPQQYWPSRGSLLRKWIHWVMMLDNIGDRFSGLILSGIIRKETTCKIVWILDNFKSFLPILSQKFYHESKNLKCKCRYFPKIPPILPAHSFLEVCYALFQRTPGQQWSWWMSDKLLFIYLQPQNWKESFSYNQTRVTFFSGQSLKNDFQKMSFYYVNG